MMPFFAAIVAAVFGLGTDYLSFGDDSLLEINIRDVGRHEVLLGPFSRFGWFHPGPALFYLMALPYRLFGRTSTGLVIGALCVNMAASGAIVGMARRRGGQWLAWWTAIALLFYLRTLGPMLLHDVWNPYITILPFVALVFCAWSIACGDRWAVPAWAVIASFLVQTHLGYLPVTVALAGITLALVAWRFITATSVRRRTLLRLAVVPVFTSVIAGFVVWLPPIVQQVMQSPHNMSEIARFSTRQEGIQTVDTMRILTLTNVGDLLASFVGMRPDVAFNDARYLPSWPGVLTLLILIAAAIVAWRRRERDALLLGAYTVVVVLLGAVSIKNVVGLPAEYLYRWVTAVGFLVMVLTGHVAQRFARRTRALGAIALILAVGATFAMAPARFPDEQHTEDVETISDAIRNAQQKRPELAVKIEYSNLEDQFWAMAVVNQLDKHGLTVHVSPGLAPHYPKRFSAGSERESFVVMLIADSNTDAAPPPGARRVARTSRITAYLSTARTR